MNCIMGAPNIKLPTKIPEDKKGGRFSKPICVISTTTLVHCCTPSLCHLGGEMIITEIQISIQRSSSWATNYHNPNIKGNELWRCFLMTWNNPGDNFCQSYHLGRGGEPI